MERRVRVGLALAVVLMSACGGEMPMTQACTPGESRACTCVGGAAGAQLCAHDGSRLEACVCDADDAAVPMHDDAGPDAGTHAALDGGLDAGDEDAGSDAGPVDAGPPSGECWLVPQAGCGWGEACRNGDWPDPPNSSPRSGPPECQPAGPMDEYDRPADRRCSLDGVDQCQAGLFCGWEGWCWRYCDPHGEPCPPLRIEGEDRSRRCVPFTFESRAVVAFHYCELIPW